MTLCVEFQKRHVKSFIFTIPVKMKTACFPPRKNRNDELRTRLERNFYACEIQIAFIQALVSEGAGCLSYVVGRQKCARASLRAKSRRLVGRIKSTHEISSLTE